VITKSDYSYDINIDLVEQGIPKFSCFDPSNTHSESVKGKNILDFHIS
jgi:hypothetical protein